MTDIISSEDRGDWPVPDAPADGPHRGALRRLGGASRTTAMTAAVSLVLLGGVATATVRSLAPGADPAQAVPASAFAIAELDLSLPDGQADAMAHLVDRFPGAPKGSGSIRDRLLGALFKTSSDPHVDYRTSIKPWLGDHVALAGWIDSAGSPQPEIVLESTDDAAARKALHTASPDSGLAFSHGFAVFAPSQRVADEAVRAADKSSLADRSTYSGDVAALGGSPAAIGWLDGPEFVKAMTHIFSNLPGGVSMLSGSGLTDSKIGRVVAGVSVSDDGANSAVQLDVIDRGSPAPTRLTSTDRLAHLPSTTFAAAAVADPAGIARDATDALNGPLKLFFQGFGGGMSCTASSDNPVDQCTTTPPSPDSDPLAAITAATGLTIPGDLEALLGSDAVIAYGGIAGGGIPKIGIRSKPADVTAAADVIRKLREHLDGSGVNLSERVDNGDFVVATTDGYANDLAGRGTLGQADRFADAMRGMPSSVTFAAYADLGTLLPLVTHGTVPQVDHLSAWGLWAGTVRGMSTTRMRLIVH